MEDIRILTEEKLHQDGEKTKNPQQNLQLLDELIKKRMKPSEGDLKIDALASKSKRILYYIKKDNFFQKLPVLQY